MTQAEVDKDKKHDTGRCRQRQKNMTQAEIDKDKKHDTGRGRQRHIENTTQTGREAGNPTGRMAQILHETNRHQIEGHRQTDSETNT